MGGEQISEVLGQSCGDTAHRFNIPRCARTHKACFRVTPAPQTDRPRNGQAAPSRTEGVPWLPRAEALTPSISKSAFAISFLQVVLIILDPVIGPSVYHHAPPSSS